MSEELGNKLLQFKQKADEAQSKADRIQGTLENLDVQLEQQGCKTKDVAINKLEKLDTELNRDEKELKVGVEELERNYDWGLG